MPKTETMTTVHFDGRDMEFLGLDAHPTGHDYALEAAVASPGQVAKIERAVADGVRYEVQYVAGDIMRPARVRVTTYGTYKEEARQAIRREADLITHAVQRLLAWTDDVVGGTSDPYLTGLLTPTVAALPTDLSRNAKSLGDLVGHYVDQFGPQTQADDQHT